jgi:drug/metabolite transporter (DMT)-like permease
VGLHYSVSTEASTAYGQPMTTVEDPAKTRKGLLAVGAAAVTVVFWASAFVAIRHVGHEYSAGALSLGRLLVGSLLLGGFVFSRPRQWPAKRDWWPLLVCGLLWFGVYNVALNEAEKRLDAGTAAMLVNIGPLLIALLAGLLLSEGFPRQLVLGSIVAFGGVVLIGTSSSPGKAETWGIILCVAAAFAYAIGVVAQKPLLGRLPAQQVTWSACTIGAVACLPFDIPGPTAHDRARVAVLDESPATLAFAGGALCLIGGAISRRGPKQPADLPAVDPGD